MDLATVDAFQLEIRKRVPGFKLAFKDESWHQRVLGLVLSPFNKRYLSDYATTLGDTVYLPSKEFYEASPDRAFSILAHEFVHLCDSKTHGRWFQASYLLPQLLGVLLAPLAVLGALISWWSLALLLPALACLAPLPSPWRSHWEARGYTMTMAVFYWMSGSCSSAQRGNIALNFYGPGYYFMTWGQSRAEKLINYRYEEIVAGRFDGEEPFSVVKAFMSERGLLRATS